MTDCWFPDNSVVVSFAHIDRLDLLESFLRGRGRVVEAVWHEIGKYAQVVPNLSKLDRSSWFGKPIRVTKSSDVQAVESLRRGVFGASSVDKQTLHLGESQTIHVVATWAEFVGSVWITEDRAAYKYAFDRGVTARDTFDILNELVAFGELTREQAFEIAEAIQNAGQPMLRPPTSPRDFD